jgi:hypothetical protein
MIRLGPSLALLAAVGLLAGCGKSEPSESTGKRKPGPPVHAGAARARALTFARAINLRAADVPGFVATDKGKEPETPAEKRLQAKLQACVRPISTRPVAEAGSPEFQRKAGLARATVHSEVTVAPSAAAARQELALIRSQRTRECVSGYIERLVESQRHPGASFGGVTVVQRTPRAPGAGGSFAWRISVPVTSHGLTIGVYFDIFGFVSGANEVTLSLSGVPAPPPAEAEEQLFVLLLERTKAAEKGHGGGHVHGGPNLYVRPS